MSLNLPIDSENSPAAPDAEAAQDTFVVDSGIDEDESLPPIYGVDSINLLPQSAARLFLHWNLARDPFEMLRKILGAEANDYRLTVCLTNESSGEESWREATDHRAMWFDVASGASYCARLVLRAENRPLIHLLTSDTMTAPHREVAPIGVDVEPEFHAEAKTFVRVLHETGYTHDALAVALENDTSARLDDGTLRLALALTGVELPLLRDDEMDELRSILAALAFGTSLDDLNIESTALSAWLARACGVDDAVENFDIESPRGDTPFETKFETTYGASDVHFASLPRNPPRNKKLQPRSLQTAWRPRSSSLNPSRVRLPHRTTSGKF